jgi:hypothetical protein
MQKPKNISLIAGIAIPLLMILFVAASIYIPALFRRPQYNFLYRTGYGYSGAVLEAKDSRLICVPMSYDTSVSSPDSSVPELSIAPAPCSDKDVESLYLHNTLTNQSKSISFADAKALSLEPSRTSPDGYEVVDAYNLDSGLYMPFGLGPPAYSYEAQYLRGFGPNQKLNLASAGGFSFLGWVAR